MKEKRFSFPLKDKIASLHLKEKWKGFRDKYGHKIYPFIFCFALILLDVSFRAIHLQAGSVGLFHWAPTLFTLCWSILLSSVIYLIPGLVKKILMGILLFIFAILTLVHATLYHIAGSFLSFSELAFAEDAAAFFSIDYLGFSFWIYFFVFLSVAIGVLAIILAPKKQKYRWLNTGIGSGCFILSFAGLFALHSAFYVPGGANKFSWTDTYDPHSDSAVYTEFNDANASLIFCGSYEYLFRSFTKILEDSAGIKQTREALDAYYASCSDERIPNEMTGVLEGQNVIAILLESIDTWMLTEEFMPNLYKIKQQSVDFSNHYTPLFLSAGTFNTEAALNIGYYLPVTGTNAYTYATNLYPYSLPQLFVNKGYTANSYHTLDGKYYNREIVHPHWGYDSFNDQSTLHFKGEPTCDTTLMESYEKIVCHDKPFFSYIITYSGHGPYTEKRQVIAEAHLETAKQLAKASGVHCDDEDTWNQYVRAIAHVRETDAMIGQLIEKMEADGTLENTAIVFFGDHYSKYLTDTDFIMELKGVDDMYRICNTPFFIYSNKLEHQVVDKVTSSVDMLPTIANLCNLDYNPRYSIGNDAFGEGGGFVCFKDYSWIDENMLWTPDYEGELTPEIKARCQEVVRVLNASWDTVKCDYFGYLAEKAEKENSKK
ncbi:MAG: hypothetical protein E7580_05010 [Ruminococcaceae bacterium]|nr:hypothetical protein [Oscillospiraceae bacterium]